jgi:hypothetical protein
MWNCIAHALGVYTTTKHRFIIFVGGRVLKMNDGYRKTLDAMGAIG